MVAAAVIAAAFGLLFLVSAAANWDWYKGIVDFAAVEGVFGESAARWLCAATGIALIGFGVVCFVQK